MFDKNVFKERFRIWSEQFPFASASEIEDFCYLHIPAEYRVQYAWLIEQSAEWFLWRQENLRKDVLYGMESVAYLN